MNYHEYQNQLCDDEARMDWLESRSQQLAADYAEEFNRTGMISQFLLYETYLSHRKRGESPKEFFVANLQKTVDETAEEIIARLATEQAEREINEPEEF